MLHNVHYHEIGFLIRSLYSTRRTDHKASYGTEHPPARQLLGILITILHIELAEAGY